MGHSLFIRELNDNHIGHVRYIFTDHEQSISASLSISVRNILGIEKKPHLHDGIVMVDLDKNIFVEIHPCSGKSSDDGLTRICKHIECNNHKQRTE